MVDKKNNECFFYKKQRVGFYTKEIEATKLNHQTIHENAFFWMVEPP